MFALFTVLTFGTVFTVCLFTSVTKSRSRIRITTFRSTFFTVFAILTIYAFISRTFLAFRYFTGQLTFRTFTAFLTICAFLIFTFFAD